jgi:penicillin G amidase
VPGPPASTARRIALGVLVLVAILVLVAGAGVLYLRSALAGRDGTLRVAGLVAPVEVTWDHHGVPQVRAASMEDALLAQGFLHARDRLWQMDLVRRTVAGRLAEVMGEEALETDRFMRRIGLWDAAVASAGELGPAERRLVQAYADGVNAALTTWSGALPPEFLVLRYRPEPWEPVHTMAVAKLMAFTLATYSEAAGAARAVRRLEVDRARHLFPDYPEWGTTTLEPPPLPPEPPPLAAALVGAFSMAGGSNAWVVSGDLSRSGRPLLANDPHLQLQAPSLWYLMGLHAPGGGEDARPLSVAGATIPGAPLVILGRNRAIAWGMTHAYVTDVDIFLERLDPSDPGRYLVPGGSQPFEVTVDNIRVRGRDEPVVLEVRRTRNGPLLPPAGGFAGDTVLAVRWTAQRPTTVFRGILGINLARNWTEFLDGARVMDEPHQNLVYADTAGHIGYVLAGTIPVRGDRRPATLRPRPGWTGEWDWTGELPFEEHPRLLDPPAGYIVTANNRQTTAAVADLIGQTWLLPFRAERITEMIGAGAPPYTTEDMLAMQLDVVDLYARRYLDRAVEAALEAGLPAVAEQLRGWDLRVDTESRAASIFQLWNEIVRRTAAADLYGGEPGYFPREAAAQVLERRAFGWREDGERAFAGASARAMRDAVDLVGGRSWGALNEAVHGHPLAGVSILDRLLGFRVGPAPQPGSATTVNVALWVFRSPAEHVPFTTTAGVSLRHVSDLGNPEGEGGFVIGTGQAGVPFSRHYDDQWPVWREGGLIPVPLSRDAAERRVRHRLNLEPEARDEQR